MQTLPWQIEKIINVAKSLKENPNDHTMSTGERIAAAFVLDEPGLLPDSMPMIDALDYVDSWQYFIKEIRRNYMHLI